MNPLLTPQQFQDRFTTPSLPKDEMSNSCHFCLPNYVMVKLAGRPSDEPAIALSGFEEEFLTIPAQGAVSSFSKFLAKLATSNFGC